MRRGVVKQVEKPLSYRGAVRRQRMERRAGLRLRGIVPSRETMVYRVDVTAMVLPVWARRDAFPGLSVSETHVWLTRRLAKMLCAEDELAGGRPAMAGVEYRRCPVCARLLLGEDAEMRRLKDESCRTGRQIPCDGECLERAGGEEEP